MRSRLLLSVALCVAFLLGTTMAGGPSGCYCGSYMFVISGKACIKSADELSLKISVAGSDSNCDSEKFSVGADGAMTFPGLGDADNCLGKVERDNSVKLNIKYQEDRNAINLDAGVASVTLKSC